MLSDVDFRLSNPLSRDALYLLQKTQVTALKGGLSWTSLASLFGPGACQPLAKRRVVRTDYVSSPVQDPGLLEEALENKKMAAAGTLNTVPAFDMYSDLARDVENDLAIISSDGGELPFRRSYLASASPAFERLLQAELSTKSIELSATTVDVEIFLQLLSPRHIDPEIDSFTRLEGYVRRLSPSPP